MMQILAAPEVGDAQSPVDRSIGRAVRHQRLRLGLSRSDLAARLGIDAERLRALEYGAERITAARLTKTAAALGVSAIALLQGAPDTLGAIVSWVAAA